MFLVQVDKNIARVSEKEFVTSGSQNCYVVEFQFSSEWDYLEKTVVFTRNVVDGIPPKQDVIYQQYVTEDNMCMIPWEVMTDPKKEIFVGVYGVKDGNVILPTVWATMGTTLMGVTTGLEPQPPTPNMWTGILNELSQIRNNLDHLTIGTLLRVFSDQTFNGVSEFLDTGLPRSFVLTNCTIAPADTVQRDTEPILSLPFVSEVVYIQEIPTVSPDFCLLHLTNMLGNTYAIHFDNRQTGLPIYRIEYVEKETEPTFLWTTFSQEDRPNIDTLLTISNDYLNYIPNLGDVVHGFVRGTGEYPFVYYIEGVVTKLDELSISAFIDTVDDMTPGRGPAGEKGDKGDVGETGATGASGITPHIDEVTKHWFIGDVDTGVLAEGVSGSDEHWFAIQSDGPTLLPRKEPDANGYFGLMPIYPETNSNIANFPEGAIGYCFVGSTEVKNDPNSNGSYLVTCKKGSYDEDFGYMCDVVSYEKIIDAPMDTGVVISSNIFLVKFSNSSPEENTRYAATHNEFVGALPTAVNTCHGLWIDMSNKELYSVGVFIQAVDMANDRYEYTLSSIIKIGTSSVSPSESYLVKAPVGTIVAWSGTIASIPKGWQLCDGTNGTPDLRGKFIFGAAEETDVGQTGGERAHALSVGEMPQHRHGINYVTSSGSSIGNTGNNTAPYAVSPQVSGGAAPTWYYFNSPYSQYDRHVSTTGSSEPHNNMPPYHALAFIMKMTRDETDTSFTPGDTLFIDENDVMNVVDPINNVVTTAEYEALTEEQKSHGLWLIKDPEDSSNPGTPPGTTVIDSVPTGTIVMWSGSLDDVPDGWVFCDGQNGTPDLRNKFVLCANPSTRPIGHTGGSETVKLTTAQMPKHHHTVSRYQTYNKIGANSSYQEHIAIQYTNVANVGTSDVGGDQPHENMPPYYALAYIMKTGQILTSGITISEYDKDNWHVRKWSDGYVEFWTELVVSDVSFDDTYHLANKTTGYMPYPIELTTRLFENGIAYTDENRYNMIAIPSKKSADFTTNPNTTFSYRALIIGNSATGITNKTVHYEIHVTGRWK